MTDKALAPSVTHKDDKGRKFVSIVETAYDKAKLSPDEAQRVNDRAGLAKLVSDFIASSRLDIMGGLIVRRVAVNRSLTPQAALAATGRKQYVTSEVAASMPQGEGDEAEVVFFKLGRYVSDNDLDKEYKLRGLVPADPYTLAAFNAADPEFADTYPNCTHWQYYASGKWCYAFFIRWADERNVLVHRGEDEWPDYLWFAGRRK